MAWRCSPSAARSTWLLRHSSRKPSSMCSLTIRRLWVIDLTEVTFLASEGLRLLATANKRFVLATASKRFGESGGFAVIAAAPATIRPIELTDLDEVFDVYLSLDDALAAMRSKHRLR